MRVARHGCAQLRRRTTAAQPLLRIGVDGSPLARERRLWRRTRLGVGGRPDGLLLTLINHTGIKGAGGSPNEQQKNNEAENATSAARLIGDDLGRLGWFDRRGRREGDARRRG